MTKKDKWRKIGTVTVLLLCFGIIGASGAAIAALVHHHFGMIGVAIMLLAVLAFVGYVWYQIICDDEDFEVSEED